MTHLNVTELHLHRTSCLTGGEFPCPVALPPEPYDPIWDEGCDPMSLILRWRGRRKKSLLLD